jgi:hypothetical protein
LRHNHDPHECVPVPDLGWHSGIPKDLSIGQIQTNKVPLEIGHVAGFSRGYGKAV